MSKKRKILKWSLIGLATVITSIVIFGFWFINILPKPAQTREELKVTTTADLPYLSMGSMPMRGKILAVVTSSHQMGNTGKSTGYELTELARPYYVFSANGFEVDVASPLGGEPPVVIDEDDMKGYDYAFLNDGIAQQKVKNSIPIKEVNSQDYVAIYFVGGKGAMFDFPQNPTIKSIVRDYYESGKVIGAVCHGPAALVNVELSNGSSLLENKQVSGFTNEEELLLIADARDVFPFLLQDKLEENGARFNEGNMYLKTISHDGTIITGQNPWSTWAVAESIVKQLGYTPKARPITAEENMVEVLIRYETEGYSEAKLLINDYCSVKKNPIDRELLAVHSLLAAYQLKLVKFVNLLRLLVYSNSFL